MNKTIVKIAIAGTLLTSFAFALPALAVGVPGVTTNPATVITTTEATLNGTNGGVAAGMESFWVSLAPIDTTTSSMPAGVYSTPTLTGVAADATFSDPLSLVTTDGIPVHMPAITPGTVYHFVAWSNVGGTWYHGADQTLTTAPAPLLGTLAAQDFGVVNYNTGLGVLKGYTAGFGLTDATFAGATSVVVKLYAAGDVLLQTNTAILPKFNHDITGVQFSSPFDVSGTFAYATDGYWTNVRGTQFGQSVPAVKVVATVTLANGKVVTATNSLPVGYPTTIYPTNLPKVGPPTDMNQCKNNGWKAFNNPTFKNQGDCVSSVVSHGDNGGNKGGHRHDAGEVLGESTSIFDHSSDSGGNMHQQLLAILTQYLNLLQTFHGGQH